MEPDFLTLLIIATPGALISLLCFVLAGVFMDRARTPAMLVMLAGLLTAMQAGFTILNQLLLMPLLMDGVLSNNVYSVLVNGAYHLLYLGITASLLTAAFIGRSRPPAPSQAPVHATATGGGDTSTLSSPAMVSAQRPHRGGLVLVLGILSMLMFAPLGIAAWIMANGDLRAMRAGQMDITGEGMTTAGKVLGILATVLMVIGICLAIGIMALGLSMHRGF